MFKTKNKKGVTLIELVVIIAIIGIMSAISIVSLTTAKRNSELESSAEELVAVIRELQNYSLSGKLNDADSPNCKNYRFSSVSSTGNYYIYNGAAPGECSINNVNTLKNGVKFSGVADIRFTAPHGVKSGGSTSITLVKGTTFYYLCVGTNGIINKKASAFADTVSCTN